MKSNEQRLKDFQRMLETTNIDYRINYIEPFNLSNPIKWIKSIFGNVSITVLDSLWDYPLELPDNLTVVGDVTFGISSRANVLPKNLRVLGCLDLRKSKITHLPECLRARQMNLSHTKIENYPIQYECGEHKRAIYLDTYDKSKIHLGCFIGTKKEAIEAVRNKYKGNERAMKQYINQIESCYSSLRRF